MIFLDYREDALIRLFNDGGSILRPNVSQRHAVEVRNLLIGDVWVATAEGVLRVIIERKTLNDLWSSIRDGRFHEQHDRAREYMERPASDGPIRYILLIEMDKTPCDMPREALMTLLTRSDERIGEGVMMIRRCDGICETAEMIRRLDEPAASAKKAERCQAEAVWSSISRTMKRRQDAITPSTVLGMLIALTPKVSFRTAQQIAGGFRDVSEFIRMMNDDPDRWESTVRPACGRMHAHIIRSMRSLLAPSGDDQKAPCASEGSSAA